MKTCSPKAIAALLCGTVLSGTVLSGLLTCSATTRADEARHARASSPTRPNILFIFSDDHAPHAIGAYGSRFAALDPTPHIDALARQGMLFKNSFCTNAICGPSRAVILTGLHSHKNGFRKNGDRFDASQTTFPKVLRAQGYETALFGKWHLQSDPEGFDTWRVLPGQGDYYNPVLYGNDDVDEAGKPQRSVTQGHCTDIVTDLAVRFLERRHQEKRDQPFLLMCQHKAPHRNWMPAPRHLGLWEDQNLPEPTTLFDQHDDDASPARLQEMEIAIHLDLVYDLFAPPPPAWDPKAGRALDTSGYQNLKRMTKSQRALWDAAFRASNDRFVVDAPSGAALLRFKYQRYIKNYLRTARGVDDSVGALVAKLDELGISDNTIVVYSSDQGFFLGDHGYYDKRFMYDEALAIPLIVRWPGVTRPGSTCEALVQNLDYAATFLEAAGVEEAPKTQGKSLVPLLSGSKPSGWRDAIYYHYHGFPDVHRVARHNGVRTARHKLLHFYQFEEWEFYDLERDPDEAHNLFEDPAYAELVASMQERLGRMAADCEDDTDRSRFSPDEEAQWRGRMRAKR